MKKKDLENALLTWGVKRGVVTFEELNEMLPAEYLPLEELERFLRRLDHLGVKIVEKAEAPKPRRRHHGRAA